MNNYNYLRKTIAMTGTRPKVWIRKITEWGVFAKNRVVPKQAPSMSLKREKVRPLTNVSDQHETIYDTSKKIKEKKPISAEAQTEKLEIYDSEAWKLLSHH